MDLNSLGGGRGKLADAVVRGAASRVCNKHTKQSTSPAVIPVAPSACDSHEWQCAGAKCTSPIPRSYYPRSERNMLVFHLASVCHCRLQQAQPARRVLCIHRGQLRRLHLLQLLLELIQEQQVLKLLLWHHVSF